MRVKYVLNEVLVGLWRNVTMTIAMIITMSVSLLMLGASVLMFMQVDQMKEFYYGEIEVSVFLTDTVKENERAAIEQTIKSSPLVKESLFEDQDKAYERFKEMWKESPDFVGAINKDSLPQSFRVKLKNPEQYEQFASGLNNLPGIRQVIDQRDLLEDVFEIFNSLQLGSLIAAGVMALAALLLVGNTIQVAAYSKRREVAVMKLVGASNWFVQAPFVLEAVVAGLIGAIVGFLGLLVLKIAMYDHKLVALKNVVGEIPDGNLWLMLPLMAGAGGLVSAITAWITLRFYLKV